MLTLFFHLVFSIFSMSLSLSLFFFKRHTFILFRFWSSEIYNQGADRTAFLPEALGKNLFFVFFSVLGLPLFLGLWSLHHLQSRGVLLLCSSSSVGITYPSCDCTEPTCIILVNLLISRSLT